MKYLISIHAAREGGDYPPRNGRCRHDISIHAAREGGDRRLRHREETCIISIHAAREGGDGTRASAPGTTTISIHAAREGGDQFVILPEQVVIFQSTPPVKAATFSPHSYVRYASNFNPRRP